jgi:hypothetical protein
MHGSDQLVSVVLMMPVVMLGVVMTARKSYREFPLFFTHIACSVFISILRQYTSHVDYPLYFKVYWITDIVYVITTILALHESFKWEFLDFYEFRCFWLVFPAIGIVIVGPAIVHALLHPVTGSAVVTAIFSVVTPINYLKAGLFGLFFLFALCFGIEWHRYPYGIVIGFGATAWGYWIAHGMNDRFAAQLGPTGKYLFSGAYLLGVAIWLVTFAKKGGFDSQKGLRVGTTEELLRRALHTLGMLKGISKYEL